MVLKCGVTTTTTTYLTPHGIRVNLAHVAARVVQLDMGDVQLPRIMAVVGDGQPLVLRHHVGVQRQNGL